MDKKTIYNGKEKKEEMMKMAMETPLNEIIKNRICTYKDTKKKLREEISSYLSIPEDCIDITDDTIDIVTDSMNKEQFCRIYDLFENVRIFTLYGSKRRIYVDLEEEVDE